jgi:hypothetical protein
VRELERRARAADEDTSRPERRAVDRGEHPDRTAAVERISDALGEALGADVHVRGSARGFTAQLHFASAEEALQFAAGLHQARRLALVPSSNMHHSPGD